MGIALVVAAAMGAMSSWLLVGHDSATWWLNSGTGVRRVAIGMAIAALASGALVRVLAVVTTGPTSGDRRPWITAVALEAVVFWLGAVVTMAVRLLLLPDGPGNIFPIVIAIGGGMLAGAIVAGWAVGASAGWALARVLGLSVLEEGAPGAIHRPR